MFCLTDMNSKTTRILSEVPPASHSTVIGDPMSVCVMFMFCVAVYLNVCGVNPKDHPVKKELVSDTF